MDVLAKRARDILRLRAWEIFSFKFLPDLILHFFQSILSLFLFSRITIFFLILSS